MATAFQYDASGFYVGTVEDYGGPLPNNATRTAPDLREGYIPQWTGKKWAQVENHKGEEGYVDGQPFTIKEYGEYPPGWSKTPPKPPLGEVKERAVATLREKRKAVEYGGVEIGGVRWDSAEKDELRLNSVMKLFESGALASYEGWKIGEGMYITLTPELLQQASRAFMQHYGRCFAVEAAKLAKINALETVEAVEAWLATELNTGW